MAKALLVLLGLLLTPLAPALAQASGCDSDTGSTYKYIRDRYTAIATDSEIDEPRAQLGIPLLTANQVGFVTDSTICRHAAAAYSQAEGDSLRVRKVYVF